MRNKLLALLLSIALLCPVLTAGAQPAEHSYTVTEVQSLCDGIASFNMVRCSASSTQGWLDSALEVIDSNRKSIVDFLSREINHRQNISNAGHSHPREIRAGSGGRRRRRQLYPGGVRLRHRRHGSDEPSVRPASAQQRILIRSVYRRQPDLRDTFLSVGRRRLGGDRQRGRR